MSRLARFAHAVKLPTSCSLWLKNKTRWKSISEKWIVMPIKSFWPKECKRRSAQDFLGRCNLRAPSFSCGWFMNRSSSWQWTQREEPRKTFDSCCFRQKHKHTSMKQNEVFFKVHIKVKVMHFKLAKKIWKEHNSWKTKVRRRTGTPTHEHTYVCSVRRAAERLYL